MNVDSAPSFGGPPPDFDVLQAVHHQGRPGLFQGERDSRRLHKSLRYWHFRAGRLQFANHELRLYSPRFAPAAEPAHPVRLRNETISTHMLTPAPGIEPIPGYR